MLVGVVAPTALEPLSVVTSEGPLLLRWSPDGAADGYRLWIAARGKGVLFEALTDLTSFAVPAEANLPTGEVLLWQVVDARVQHPSAVGWNEFVIATPQARLLAQRIDRANPTPSTAERNLRELLLLQRMSASR
jgi:hypothetical protein